VRQRPTLLSRMTASLLSTSRRMGDPVTRLRPGQECGGGALLSAPAFFGLGPMPPARRYLSSLGQIPSRPPSGVSEVVGGQQPVHWLTEAMKDSELHHLAWPSAKPMLMPPM